MVRHLPLLCLRKPDAGDVAGTQVLVLEERMTPLTKLEWFLLGAVTTMTISMMIAITIAGVLLHP